jgi:glutamine synthetase adenylyltransferase
MSRHHYTSLRTSLDMMSRPTQEERSLTMMKLMEKMMGFMMDRTSTEEKQEMMAEMMDRFFATMTPEDKQNMMQTMMPRMMEGVNMMEMMPQMMRGMMGGEHGERCMEMMSKTTGGGQGMETFGMPQMMMEMMPHCLTMMLPHLSKDKRMELTLTMLATLMQQSCADMSEEEKHQFVAQVIDTVHAAEMV